MPVKTNISAKLFVILREASFIQQDSEEGGLFCFIFLAFEPRKFFDGILKMWKVSSCLPCSEIIKNTYSSQHPQFLTQIS